MVARSCLCCRAERLCKIVNILDHLSIWGSKELANLPTTSAWEQLELWAISFVQLSGVSFVCSRSRRKLCRWDLWFSFRWKDVISFRRLDSFGRSSSPWRSSHSWLSCSCSLGRLAVGCWAWWSREVAWLFFVAISTGANLEPGICVFLNRARSPSSSDTGHNIMKQHLDHVGIRLKKVGAQLRVSFTVFSVWQSRL